MKFFESFSTENDIEEQQIKGPQDYRYLKVARAHMLPINIWPKKEMGENVSKFNFLIIAVNLFVEIFYCLDLILFVRNNMKTISFFVIGHSLVMLLMNSLALSRIFMTSTKKFRNIYVEYLKKMHLFYFKGFSDHAMKTHKQIHRISHIYTLWMLGELVLALIFLNIGPIHGNYKEGNYQLDNLVNSTYEHAIYLELPFDTSKNFNGYLFATFVNVVDIVICGSWFAVVDLQLGLVVLNLWGHYKVLLLELDSFPLPAEKETLMVITQNANVDVAMYSDDELKEVTKRLIRCIDYHRLIANYTNRISESYGPLLFLYYGFHQAIGCLLLLECSQMTAEAFLVFGPLTVATFQQLIQLSSIFELLGSTSEKLKDAVYGVPWELMDVKTRKIVAIFLTNVQEPIHVKALGLARVGVATMAAIIKTSFTYFTFLIEVS